MLRNKADAHRCSYFELGLPVMFLDECIILFLKFPFCGDFSLHLHKMVQETSRKLEIYKGMFFETR